MDQLAQACGITKPVLYRYFTDRDGLISAIADDFVAQLTDQLAVVLDIELGGEVQVPRAATTYLNYVTAHREIYEFLIHNITTGTHQSLVFRVADQIGVGLAAHRQLLGVDDSPSAMWAVALVGMFAAATDWWLASSADSLNVESVVDSITTLVRMERLDF